MSQEPQKNEKPEIVNHPSHYTYGVIEVIELTSLMSFDLGCAVKYLLRYQHKGKPIEDLQKASWYVEHAKTLPIPRVNSAIFAPLKIYLDDTESNDFKIKTTVQALCTAESNDMLDLALSLIEERIEELSA